MVRPARHRAWPGNRPATPPASWPPPSQHNGPRPLPGPAESGRSERKRFGRAERHGVADEFGPELSAPLRTMAMTTPGRTVRTEEDVMHPIMADAIAAERARELQAA